MTDTPERKYSLDDMFTSTNSEKGSKMPLFIHGDVDTGHYLKVKGNGAKSVAKSRLTASKNVGIMNEESLEFAEGPEREEFILDALESIKLPYAIDLVCGWSFDETITPELVSRLITENDGLSDSIINHASNEQNLLSKK